MKKGYICGCGWKLARVGKRRDYAHAKELHAVKCELMKAELKRSGKEV